MHPQSQAGLESVSVPAQAKLDGFYLSRVADVSVADHTVHVLLPNLGSVTGSQLKPFVKAHVLERRASQLVGEVALPRVGDWGVVIFPGGSPRLAVWLGSLYQDLSNICTEAPETDLAHYEGGTWSRVKADGTVEFVHPSGTYIRLGSGTALATDPQTGTPRAKHERQGQTVRKVAYAIPSKPAVTLHVEHSSGAKFTIAPDGEVTIAAASGKFLHLAGTAGEDFIALKSALDKILATFNAHTHTGVQGGSGSSGPPGTPLAAFIPDTDYTGQAKAT